MQVVRAVGGGAATGLVGVLSFVAPALAAAAPALSAAAPALSAAAPAPAPVAAAAPAPAPVAAALSAAATPALASGRTVMGPAGPPPCSVLPVWTVRSLLGEEAQTPVQARSAPGGTTCAYAVGTNSLGVQVTFLQVPWPAFETVEQDYLKNGAVNVPGIGQAAFAVASRGTTYENLFFYGDGYNIGITAEAPLSKMENLAKALLVRLQ
jgi:hypothetical protein